MSQLSSSSLSSSLSLPLLLTALSPPTVRTVAGLCRGHGLPGSERHCLYPGGAADIRITAELHRAEGSPWPSVAELSSLSLSLLVDPLHPLQLEPPSLQVQLVAAHLQSASSLHRLAVPFWGVLSASFARVGIFDLLFVVDQSSGLLSLGNINSSVAVEVRTATDTRLPSLRASRAPFAFATATHSVRLPRLLLLSVWWLVCVRGDMQRWHVLQRSKQRQMLRP